MSLTDPFLDITNCADRLYKEWQAHKRLIVAVDFDDTVYDYHVTGASHAKVFDVLHKCQDFGFYIVVFTASVASRFDFIRQFLREKGIAVSSINQNPIKLPYGNHGKIYYNILLDDRAGLWSALITLKMVLERIQADNEKQLDELNKLV